MTELGTHVRTEAAKLGFRVWGPPLLGSVLPWLLLLVLIRPLVGPTWPPFAWSGSLMRWASGVVGDIGFFLPFLLFAGGSALVRVLGLSRRLIRIALVVGMVSAAMSYACHAIAAPMLAYQSLADRIPDIEESRPFGPDTPAGLLRNLRFVQANQPEQYSLSTDDPGRRPPSALRWQLHRPMAIAVFGIINILMGALVAEATSRMERPAQWNTRLAIGVAGAIAFYSLQRMGSPIQAFLRDEPMGSGVVSAWLPLGLPLAGALLLWYLVGRREQ